MILFRTKTLGPKSSSPVGQRKWCNTHHFNTPNILDFLWTHQLEKLANTSGRMWKRLWSLRLNSPQKICPWWRSASRTCEIGLPGKVGNGQSSTLGVFSEKEPGNKYNIIQIIIIYIYIIYTQSYTYIYLHPHCDAVFLPLGKKNLSDISGCFCKVAALCDDRMFGALKSSQINSTKFQWTEISWIIIRNHPWVDIIQNSSLFYFHCSCHGWLPGFDEIFLARWACFSCKPWDRVLSTSDLDASCAGNLATTQRDQKMQH